MAKNYGNNFKGSTGTKKANSAKSSVKSHGASRARSNRNTAGKSRYKTNRERNNAQDEFADREFDKGIKSATNDPAWYMTNAQLANDTGNFVFGYPSGYEIQISEGKNTPSNVSWITKTGNVEIMFLAPTVGYANSPTDPINIAAAEYFNLIRRDQTGSSTFTQEDLMLSTLAVADVYSYINYLQRVYGMIDLLPLQNKFTPQQLMPQVNFDDVQNNRAKFRAQINMLISYAAAFCVPAGMPYFNRKAFLYQNLFSDGVDIKSTIYILEPFSFYQWSQGTAESPAGKLTQKTFFKMNNGGTSVVKFPNSNAQYTADQLFQFGLELIAPLRASDDIRFMSAAVLKAVGDGGLIKLSTLPEVYPIAPLVDPHVLAQFKNATINTIACFGAVGSYPYSLTCSSNLTLPDVTQNIAINNSYLSSIPSVNINYLPSSNSEDNFYFAGITSYLNAATMATPIILSADGDTSPSYAFEATRLVARVRSDYSLSSLQKFTGVQASITAAQRFTYPLDCGTELVVFAYYVNQNTWVSNIGFQGLAAVQSGSSVSHFSSYYNAVTRKNLIQNGSVDYSTPYYVYSSNKVGPSGPAATDIWMPELDGVHFDFNSYALIKRSDFEMMNRVALYSLMSFK